MKLVLLPIAAMLAVMAYGQTATDLATVSSPATAPAVAGSSDFVAPPADPPYVYAPMSNRQKFNWTMGCIWSPTWLFYSGARAGLDQWKNDPSSWGQGVKGYARRFGAAHELEAFEDTVWFAGAALTHEDPRYLRSGRTGFFPRLADALEVGLLSRRDSGSVGFAYARTVAGMGTKMFERVVFPDQDAFTTRSILMDAVGYVALREAQSIAREFLPDILKGNASKAVRNLSVPLTAPARPLPAAPPQTQQP